METKQLLFEAMVDEVLSELRNMLITKNKNYGNSALEPCRVFSKATAREQILVRIDDKLSRIKTRGVGACDEDTVLDLMGYLVLLKISRHPTLCSENQNI